MEDETSTQLSNVDLIDENDTDVNEIIWDDQSLSKQFSCYLNV
jgi:hypothetical protein